MLGLAEILPIVGKDKLVRRCHAHKAGVPALEIAGRVPFGGGRSEEEKTLTLDEGPVGVGEGCARGHLLKPVGDATAVKLILKAPIAVVILDGHERRSRNLQR
jgi:hypothetical protein